VGLLGFFDVFKFWHERREKRTDVRVRVHEAAINDSGGWTPCYFVNVLNASPEREVTVTHVWFETDPPVHFVNPDRPLPARIRPRDQWETWIEAARVPAVPPGVLGLARARLADDRVLHSVAREDVPPVGMIPGG
jgi:hypothetical protein